MKTKRARKGWTRRTSQQQIEHLQAQCDSFNKRFPVGSRVWYWTSLTPGSPVKETLIRRPAALIAEGNSNAGRPVCFLIGIAGYVCIHHVQDVQESQRKHVKPLVLVGA